MFAASRLQNQPPLQLTQLVREFFSPRIIEYRCECKNGTELHQSPRIRQLPRILVLHLKRFQYNELRGTFEKRKEIVRFSNVIDLSPYVTPDVGVPDTPGDQEEQQNGKSANANLLSRFNASSPGAVSSPPRSDRKRKEADSPAVERASNKSAKREPDDIAACEATEERRYQQQVKEIKQQHEGKCDEIIDHDNCLESATQTYSCAPCLSCCFVTWLTSRWLFRFFLLFLAVWRWRCRLR